MGMEMSLCEPGIMSGCSGYGNEIEDKEKRKECKFYEAKDNKECLWYTFDSYCYSTEAQKHWQKRQ